MVWEVLKKGWTILAIVLLVTGSTWAQRTPLETFLKEKQVWNEKLIIVYAPAGQQQLVQEQLNAFQPFTQTFRAEKMVVVPLPEQLSKTDRSYLQTRLHLQPDRFMIWVIDEKGTLRMAASKPVPPDQLLRLLNVQERPQGVAQAQLFW